MLMISRTFLFVVALLIYTGDAIPLQQASDGGAWPNDLSLKSKEPTPDYPIRAQNPMAPLVPSQPSIPRVANQDENGDVTTTPPSAPNDGEETTNPTSTTKPNIRPGLLTTCQAEHQFALTFDDGPFEYTSALIDLLIKEGVKATFFINGKNYWSGEKINPDIKKAYDAGCEIGSHTFTHPKLSSLSEDKIKAEMAQNEQAIYNAIQQYPAVMRPPYGDVTDANVKYLNSLDYTVVTWSIDIEDWKKAKSVDEELDIVKTALQDSKNHNIILQHDVYNQTASVFAPKVIEFVKSQNLEFVTMSECLGVDAYKSNPIPT